MSYLENFIPSIENSFEKLECYPNVSDRYYQPFYFVSGKGASNEHFCVLIHSNKICLVTLAPSHPVIKYGKTIVNIDFKVSEKIDRLENKVKGKGKRGAQHIQPDSTLCYIQCNDGSEYTVWGCIRGKLLEMNQVLIKSPEIMTQKPFSNGFIAIILPCLKDLELQKKKLLSSDEYKNLLD